MAEHALLSPSGASRWLVCTPSARFEQEFPDTESEAAKEGTLAHKLAEIILQLKLKLITKQKYEVELKQVKKNPLYNVVMHSHCDDYSVFVLERLYSYEDAAIDLEFKIPLKIWIPEGFGTIDIRICAPKDRVLEIIDFKYGKGVEVSAQENKQMMVYGLGSLGVKADYHVYETVKMTIYQPRLDNVSTFKMPGSDLLLWGREVLKPAAELAFDGRGEFVPGDYCRFCRAKGICRATASQNLELAKYDFKADRYLTPEEVSDILDRAAPFTNWLKGVLDYAQAEALTGKKWPGYKLVSGRSNRVYSDEAAIAETLIMTEFSEDVIYKKTLLNLTDMENAIGAANFAMLVEPFITKPTGKPTLVPVGDKRIELNSLSAAIKEFQDDADLDDLIS